MLPYRRIVDDDFSAMRFDSEPCNFYTSSPGPMKESFDKLWELLKGVYLRPVRAALAYVSIEREDRISIISLNLTNIQVSKSKGLP